MLTIKDFIEKYEGYSDEQLFEINSQIDRYSDEAKEALSTVLRNKGGIEKIRKDLADKKAISDEIKKINAEVAGLCSKETNAEFIKTLISSNVLSQTEVNKIIDEKFNEFTIHVKANSVNVRVIFLALLGITISSIISGILWSWLIKQSNKIPIFLIVGLGFFCYLTIIFLTKQSKYSLLVMISTIIAIVLSLLIGGQLSFI